MSCKTLNLGILAHVDAGKTTLTERLLFAAGVIDELGSVDAGTTQTDSLALEQQRGITIKSAVVSFAVDDVTINLIDTPGHPDFIAEVERVLSVLDGAVLVISAVEGVQAQTRVLMRALQRLAVPTLIFINKVDRRGADCGRVLEAVADKLTPAVIPIGDVIHEGSRDAAFVPYSGADFLLRLEEALAEHDDALLRAYVDSDNALPYDELRDALADQTRRAVIHPVVMGSARTGAGLDAVVRGITTLLPASARAEDGPAAASVFKVERGDAGEKIAYVSVRSGAIRVRDRLELFRHGEPLAERGKVTALTVFDDGRSVNGRAAVAGRIARLWGLTEVQVGDEIGSPAPSRSFSFAPPTLESMVVPRSGVSRSAVHTALAQLAEQDPLINLRRGEQLFVSIYGEVQKEVIQATLATEFGLDVDFRETTPICVERPIGSGAAVETLGEPSNPFLATVGLRVEPGSGVSFRTELGVRSIPLYVYKTAGDFSDAMGETVRTTLEQGLYGWQVVDWTVTMTDSGYSSPDTTSGDFRKLTPLVLMRALHEAGTEVCEPVHSFRLDVPADSLHATLRALARLGAVPQPAVMSGSSYAIEGTIAAVQTHRLQQELRALTHGEGVLEFAFDHYRPVSGTAPTRPRTDHNPLNRDEYLMHLARRTRS